MSIATLTQIAQFVKNAIINGIDVHIQSQTSQLFQYFLMNEQKTDITLTSAIKVDDEVINVSASHGFTAASGEYLVVRNGDSFAQLKVKSVATNAITVTMPITSNFPLSAIVIRGNINMNIDGDAAPTTFLYSAHTNENPVVVPIDISTIILTMQHGANVPDDGKFGGLAALTNGIYFRKVNSDVASLGNYQTNQDFKAVGGVVEYTSKAPAGTNGTNIVFDIETIFGQVIRMNPRTNDRFTGNIRDDIASDEGMALLTVSIIGSFTSGE